MKLEDPEVTALGRLLPDSGQITGTNALAKIVAVVTELRSALKKARRQVQLSLDDLGDTFDLDAQDLAFVERKTREICRQLCRKARHHFAPRAHDLDPDLQSRAAAIFGTGSDPAATRGDPTPTSAHGPYLLSGGGGEPMKAAGETVQTEKGSQRRYTKDIIRIGQFRHPLEGWELNVDRRRLHAWAETFATMKTNGVPVEVFADHGQPGQRADKIRGYVEDMRVEGDSLVGVFVMTGDDGIRIAEAARNVSAEVSLGFVDGRGTQYDDAITAVAVCEKPLVPGQRAFTRVASLSSASLDLAGNRDPDLDSRCVAVYAAAAASS